MWLITHQVEQAGVKNYTLVDAAAGIFDGKATFNIAGRGDWGRSSLEIFSEGLDKTWPGRTDFKVTEQIEVQVLRLDTFLSTSEFKSIAYMHCDMQGSDLDVLRGLGRFRENLQRGVIECASARSVALYREQHLLQDASFEFAHGVMRSSAWSPTTRRAAKSTCTSATSSRAHGRRSYWAPPFCRWRPERMTAALMKR